MLRRKLLSLVVVAMLSAMTFSQSAFAQYTPEVVVTDQAIVDGTVTITRATVNGPGWMVIHADVDGKPGPVIGHAELMEGISSGVLVEVDPAAATEVLYAMLHVDEGTVGVYEFPDGPDVPVMVNDAMVAPAFTVVSAPAAESAEAATSEEAPMEMPSVEAADQESTGEQVTVAMVTAAQNGWMVIHLDAEGNPGPVIGKTAVPAGMTENVIVLLDEPIAGETALWAMLHVDEGEMGVYEFPDGPDVPVTVEDAIVMAPFIAAAPEAEMAAEEAEPAEAEMAAEEPAAEAEAAEGDMAAEPGALPETGADFGATAPVAVVGFVTLVLAGGAWMTRRRPS